MKQVKCKSGIMGVQLSLRKNYDNSFEQFQSYDLMFNISTRLGYKSTETAWKANPTIQVSVNPSDLRKVPKKKLKK